MRSFSRLLSVLFAALFLYGCAGVGTAAVLESIREAPGDGAYIEAVPFFPDHTRMCGPSVLASLTGFYKSQKGAGSYESIAKAIYFEKLGGTLSMDMLIYARESGFEATLYSGGLDDLKEKLKAGRPLILFINLGLDIYPVGHYIVAVGYSESKKAVIARSGVDKDKVFGYAELKRAWKKTGYSTIYITPAVPVATPDGKAD